MAANLQLCMNKCNLIIKDISVKQQAEIRSLVMKHMAGIQDKYMDKIFDLISKKDMVGIVKVIRLIIKEKEFKEKFIILLDDISGLYKKNKENVNKITSCFLSNCNTETVEFIGETCGLVYDLFNTLNDNTVHKKMEVIRKYIIENIKHAEDLLQVKNAKKTNVSKVKKSKK